jgi:Family of unknown function (DUF6174)
MWEYRRVLRIRLAASLALALVFGGCDSSSVLVSQEVADFAEMRELRQVRGIKDYYVEYQLSNEWVPPYILGVEVRGGVVTRVRGSLDYSTLQPSNEWQSPDDWERTFAVDSLYLHIAREIADPEASVGTRFDTRFGLLTVVSVDRARMADDAYRYEVKRFERQ